MIAHTGGVLQDLAATLERETKNSPHCNDTIFIIHYACNDLFLFTKGASKRAKTVITYKGLDAEILAGATRLGKAMSNLNNVIMIGPDTSQLWECDSRFDNDAIRLQHEIRTWSNPFWITAPQLLSSMPKQDSWRFANLPEVRIRMAEIATLAIITQQNIAHLAEALLGHLYST